MSNKEKIKEIEALLSEGNCAGVEVEFLCPFTETNEKQYVTRRDALMRHRVEKSKNILSIKPIPIELDPLAVGDRVWANGELGEVIDIPDELNGWAYLIHFAKDPKNFFQRNELIKASYEQ